MSLRMKKEGTCINAIVKKEDEKEKHLRLQLLSIQREATV